MTELNISPNFTVDDIHKIREYNYEMTKDMPLEKKIEYYRKGAELVEKEIMMLQKRIA